MVNWEGRRFHFVGIAALGSLIIPLIHAECMVGYID